MSRTATQILDDCCTELNAKGQAHIAFLLQHVKQCHAADRDAIIEMVDPPMTDGVWAGTVAEAVQATISRLTAERDGAMAVTDALRAVCEEHGRHPNESIGEFLERLETERDGLRKALEPFA